MITRGQHWGYSTATTMIWNQKTVRQLVGLILSLVLMMLFVSCARQEEPVSHEMLLKSFSNNFDRIDEAIRIIEEKQREICTLMENDCSGCAKYSIYITGLDSKPGLENLFAESEWQKISQVFSEFRYTQVTCFFSGPDQYAIQIVFFGTDSQGEYCPLCFVYTPFGYPSAILDYIMFSDETCISLEYKNWYMYEGIAPIQ